MNNRQSNNQHHDHHSQQLFRLQMSIVLVYQVLNLHIDSLISILQMNMKLVCELAKQVVTGGQIPSSIEKIGK